jgi:hypothetical protein
MIAPDSVSICVCWRCRTSPRIKRAAKRVRARFMNPRLVVRGTTIVGGRVAVLLEDPLDSSGPLTWTILEDVAQRSDLGHVQELAS